MKEFYTLVVSILDEYGNRIDAHEICGSNDKTEILGAREHIIKKVEVGYYDKYANFEQNESIMVDIEVHDDDTYSLLWIE